MCSGRHKLPKCTIIGLVTGDPMKIPSPSLSAITMLLVLLLSSSPAHALRCGNKLVKDGMHEVHVRAICGEPVATLSLGFVLRYYDPYSDRHGLSYYTRYYGYGARRELPVTEMLFNFGPHKLMRRIRFEGGRVTSIETAGYGFHK